MMSRAVRSSTAMALVAVIIVCSAAAFFLADQFLVQRSETVRAFSLSSPITHKPAYLGSHNFILGSGNVLENGTAYSYIVLNASAISKGDTFVVLPALNVGLSGRGIDENNLTMVVVFSGSSFGEYPYWINFSNYIPSLNLHANFSQAGIEGTFVRSNKTIFTSPPTRVLLFNQISNVVGESNEFEYFFYIGNSTTPPPQLTHGPVH
jgi:hypothetical protein